MEMILERLINPRLGWERPHASAWLSTHWGQAREGSEELGATRLVARKPQPHGEAIKRFPSPEPLLGPHLRQHHLPAPSAFLVQPAELSDDCQELPSTFLTS